MAFNRKASISGRNIVAGVKNMVTTLATSAALRGPDGFFAALKERYGDRFDPAKVDWESFPPDCCAWAACMFPVPAARHIVKMVGADLFYGDTSLCGWCASVGDLRRINMLLSKGADPDGRIPGGWSPAHAAAAAGHETILASLIENGCNVRLEGPGGETACHYACISGSFGCLGLLIGAGADPFMPDLEGRTPLYRAAEAGNRKCTRMLVSMASFDPKHVDTAGMSPLHACRNVDCASILVSAGVDPRLADACGRKPWQTCRIQEVRDFLMTCTYAKRRVQPAWGRIR
jgi:hypothetical protein